MRDNVLYVFVFVFIIAAIILSPLATIWSLNTLFSLNIAYTVWTWLAAVWLSMVTFGNIAYTIRSKK